MIDRGNEKDMSDSRVAFVGSYFTRRLRWSNSLLKNSRRTKDIMGIRNPIPH